MSEHGLPECIEQVAERLMARGWMLTAAESCTGGWIAKTATDVAGSSRWFDRGFVTYSNEAKQDMLGVSGATLEQHGAVSEATVRAMAEGALQQSRARLSVAVSGIAGPSGGTPEKPVGTVWFAWAVEGQPLVTRCERLDGDRDAIRYQSVVIAWQGLRDALGQ